VVNIGAGDGKLQFAKFREFVANGLRKSKSYTFF